MGFADLLTERAVGGQHAIEATVQLGQVRVRRVIGSDGHHQEVGLDIPWLAVRDVGLHRSLGSKWRQVVAAAGRHRHGA
jgi:hypothetical protein